MYLTSIRRSPVHVTSNGCARARACVYVNISNRSNIDTRTCACRSTEWHLCLRPSRSIYLILGFYSFARSLSSTIRTSSLDCAATVYSQSAGLSHRLYYSQHVGRFESDARVEFFRASPSFHQQMICNERSINSFDPFSVLCLSFLLHLGLTKSFRP